MKKILLILVMMMMTLTCVYAEDTFESIFEKGEVLAVEEVESDNSYITKIQYVDVKILSGEYKDEVVQIENGLSDSYVTDIEVEVGQRVLLQIDKYSDGSKIAYITSHERDRHIIFLLLVFIAALLIVGKLHGIKTIFTLGVTVFFIFFVELPLLVRGHNAIWVTVVVAMFITVITVTVISGLTKKTLAAIIGTTFGVVLSGGIAIVVSNQAHLTGMAMEEAIMLLTLLGDKIDFRQLLFAAILLGTLGAVMDVAMSIASSIDELHNVNPNLSARELFSSGMRVGRDIMGTMANTLILAYAGSSLALMLLFTAASDNLSRLVNLDVVATEIIRSLSGSIGLVATIPLTALVSVFLIKDKRFRQS
ncbi:YibE/F family protein [Acidaminobacter sp. JC074]|uniref:YibE/F family protein n=1 Tax=Acidaminobacter sp. JC074 TaxID=2530199 RepID=UPI001F0EF0D9|nr:YibE/F family protein [Acidaminobacter sp. JC074]MCH4887744.1 YibE/F family protein [Acidaminobacter sp. JC074]